MADMANNKIDMSAEAFEIAKTTGFGSDESKFKEFEKELVKKVYEVLGLSDIPEEFLNIGKFVEAYSGVLVKSVQNDIALMNLTKRLAMFRLSENIQNTAEKPATPDAPTATTPAAEGSTTTGFDPLAK